MRKYFALILFLTGFVFCAFAQQNNEGNNFSNLDAADPALVGNETAEQRIKEVSIDKFENEGTWTVRMSSDEGIIRARLFDGNPKNKKAIPAEEGLNIPDNKVLGVKVSYYRRGHNSFEVEAVKPLPVEGIAKTASVWVVGRSYPHKMKFIVEDFWGKRFELYVGKLNHSGWKLMTVAIPPQNASGRAGIVQKDYHYGTSMGLKVVGFRIECDPLDAYGHYYIYFDDLRVVSDLYEVDMRDDDDMADNW